MQLDFSTIIEKLKMIEKKFNASQDPVDRYALIQALNYIGEVEIPIHGHFENTYRDAMLKKIGECL